MHPSIPPFPEFRVGKGAYRYPGYLPSREAAKLEKIHKQLRADASSDPGRFEYFVCRAIQQCFDLFKKTLTDGGSTPDYDIMRTALPKKCFVIAIECGWLPEAALANGPVWQEWITQLLAGRFNRAWTDAEPSEPDPYFCMPFPSKSGSEKIAVEEHASAQPRPASDTADAPHAESGSTGAAAATRLSESSPATTAGSGSARESIALSSFRTPDLVRPRRTPDLHSSRERLALVSTLARELAVVKQDLMGFCTADGLKQKHPKFTLWTLIEDSAIQALTDGEAFTPKAYAENLTLSKFGLTSRETLKKDRRKLRKAKMADRQ